jgi:hypothetical protein
MLVKGSKSLAAVGATFASCHDFPVSAESSPSSRCSSLGITGARMASLVVITGAIVAQFGMQQNGANPCRGWR